MNVPVRRINQELAQISASVGYFLWRDTLARKSAYYTDLSTSGSSLWERRMASVMASGLHGAVFLRGHTAQPAADRFTGTGWDNARPPGDHPATDVDSKPDIDRLDLGSWHRTLARCLGGSDAAVLAVHPLFFAARMLRHGVVASITAIGFAGGCVVSALQGGWAHAKAATPSAAAP